MRENSQNFKSDKEKQKLRLGEFSVHNFPHIGSPYALIPLTQGKYAIVDAEDYKWLNQWKWHAVHYKNTFYAARTAGKYPHQHQVLMHREILNPPKGRETDHNNHNGLDNRKQNIRICTSQQNHQNQKAMIGTSKFKGVSWQQGRIYKGKQYKGKWHAQICYNYKGIFLGSFDNEIDAAKAYDKKAKELFGRFAKLNLSADSAPLTVFI